MESILGTDLWIRTCMKVMLVIADMRLILILAGMQCQY